MFQVDRPCGKDLSVVNNPGINSVYIGILPVFLFHHAFLPERRARHITAVGDGVYANQIDFEMCVQKRTASGSTADLPNARRGSMDRGTLSPECHRTASEALKPARGMY